MTDLQSLTTAEFLRAVAAKSPTPGGGAVAALTAALAAALGQMVVRYTRGKKKYAEHETMLGEALDALEAMVSESMELAAADAEAYERLNELWKLDEDDPQRQREWADAVEAAIAAPRGVLQLACRMLECLRSMVGRTNRMLRSDLAIAAVLAEAGARAAAWNVRINLPLVTDQVALESLRRELDGRLHDAQRSCREIEQACR